jgi:hypothetical protein
LHDFGKAMEDDQPREKDLAEDFASNISIAYQGWLVV